MLTVIDTMGEYHRMCDALNSAKVPVSLAIPSDINEHPCGNRISLMYYATPDAEWVMGMGHNDLPKTNFPNRRLPIALTLDASFFHRYGRTMMDASFFMDKPHLDDWYNVGQREYHRKFHSVRFVNDAIPLKMHLDMFRTIRDEIREAWNGNHNWRVPALDHYSTQVHQVLSHIEESGVAVDTEMVPETFGAAYALRSLKGEYLYTKYNPYTLTGRPSNSWDGVNFAALPKKTGVRKILISRFGSTGRLVNFDFKSFHLYLLANYLGEDLPSEDVHTWLGCRYFNTDTLTPEQYEQSKVKTFGILYGSERIEEGVLPFFDAVQKLRSGLYEQYQLQGFVWSGRCSRPIYLDEGTENKVFNYWVQNLETEIMIDLMGKMFTNGDDLNPPAAFPVLYTYDSVLFDCVDDDVQILVDKVTNICKEYHYPVRVEVGINYGELEKYTLPS